MKILILFFLVLVAPGLAQSSDNYCDDIEAWSQWKALVAKYPEDDNLAAGYALRLGLCQQIKASEIENDRAISIFDNYMEALKWEAEMRVKRTQDSNQEKGI